MEAPEQAQRWHVVEPTLEALAQPRAISGRAVILRSLPPGTELL